MDLSELTLTRFEPHLGSAFTVQLASGEALALALAEARAAGAPHRAGARTPFALLLRHPALPGQAYLPQGVYRLEHAVLGALDVFMVPLGPDAGGMRYEIIFA